MTFRPLTNDLTQAIDRYQKENFLPSRNAAINQILSRALLGGNQAPAPAAPALTPTAPAAPTPAAPIGWD